MANPLQHVRVGYRSLRRAPAFAAIAIFTLALGIGLSTAVFTVAEALLFRRLAVTGQDRLVILSGQPRDGRVDNYPLGVEEAREFSRRTVTLGATATFAYEGASPKPVRDGGELTRLRRSLVSGNYFEVLGVQPLLGRTLVPEDDVPGATPVVVLSHRAWRERFGGAREVLGRQLVMHQDGASYTIVGVMPQGLDYPRGTDIWAPVLAATPEASMPYVAVHVIGRLLPSATASQAAAEVGAFFAREGAPRWQGDLRGVARTFPEVVVGDTRRAVLVFLAASGFLLLITCINVANLLLVRGLRRMQEVAVRSALGAGRRQIIVQLLTEHALLAAAGAIVGLFIAGAAVRTFVAVAPPGLPRLDEIALNAAALTAAAGIAALAMLLFALMPAIVTSRVDLAGVLRSGSRQSPTRGSRFASEALIVGQVVLAFVILSAAGLLGRSFLELQRADLSFEPTALVVTELAVRHDLYGTPARQRVLLEQVIPEMEALPGVSAVTPVVAVPFSGNGGWDGKLASAGQTQEETAANPLLNMEVVTPSYFGTFGLPMVAGRSFTGDDREGSPAVVIASQSTAKHFWPDDDPIGKRLTLGPPEAQREFTVVGVVPDTRYRDLRTARASIYFPLAQSFFPFTPTTLVIRTSADPGRLRPALQRVLEETAPGVELASTRSLEEFLEEPLAQPRLNALLLVAFAGAAVVLAAIGLFGVMATMVRQRARELGVRMALGATGAEIGRLVLRRGMTLAAVGTGLGVIAAVATNRLLAGMLFGVSPTDVPTLLSVACILLGVAALASALPARSGTRIEPLEALRAD